ncbi:hypothetical protein GQ42DRAFT_116263, partial [Ramicandelaber brevisporus]
LDEILDRWRSDLQDNINKFHTHAKVLSNWDDALRGNTDRLAVLRDDATRLEQRYSQLEQNLTYVEAQQTEMANVLTAFERQVESLVSAAQHQDGLRFMPTPEESREQIYLGAEAIEKELQRLAKQLNGMIDQVNTVAGGPVMMDASTMSTFGDVLQILNTHIPALEELDSECTLLDSQFRDFQRL